MTVARERPDVRGRTVVLDAVGNTVKALTKAWAAGAAALGSMLLVRGLPRRGPAPARRVGRRRGAGCGAAARRAPVLHLDRPEVFLGALVGILLVLWLASRCIVGVARAGAAGHG